jgi:SAM-dependent methyltransferase
MYQQGTYFTDPRRHAEDGRFKALDIGALVLPFLRQNGLSELSLIDVGCGSGTFIIELCGLLAKAGVRVSSAKGYDISPHVAQLRADNIVFVHQDFLLTHDRADLILMTDVFEHVTDPLAFIGKVGQRCRYLAFHIPLEDCLVVNLRGLQTAKIVNPGHLIFLNLNTALNLIALAGLQTLTFAFAEHSRLAPSNQKTWLQRLAFPFKWVLAKLNPYLYSKIFGGSLVLLAKGNLVENDRP